MKLDVLSLEELFDNYDKFIFETEGISIKEENIMTNSS